MTQAPRIVLIHAVAVAMAPIGAAMARLWPEAEAVNLLDDSLSVDRARETALDAARFARIAALAGYAGAIGAEGILFTCSAFGAAIEQAAAAGAVPVLKPNQPMFEAAAACGGRIGMLATFAPAVAGMEAEFAAEALKGGSSARLRTVVVPEAMAALRRGDEATHNRLLAERAGELSDCDAIMLAHFSTSRAAEAVRAAVPVPVFSSPDAAVIKLRGLVTGKSKR
jgi:aspartate/glutamate racemase